MDSLNFHDRQLFLTVKILFHWMKQLYTRDQSGDPLSILTVSMPEVLLISKNLSLVPNVHLGTTNCAE